MNRSGRYSSWHVGAVTLLVALLGVLPLARPAAAQITNFGLTATRGALFSGLAQEISNIPNPSGGGFTFRFDPGTGVFERTTEGFGPIFSQRADTTGAGRITLTAGYVRHTFDEIDGTSLRNGEVVGLINVSSGGFSRLNLIQYRQDVSADVFSLGVTYGVTDRMDIGVTLPIAHVKVKENPRRVAFIDCPEPVDPTLRNCFNFNTRSDNFISQNEDNTDLGDLVLKWKYNFMQFQQLLGGRAGLAAAIDVKLPTGDRGDRNTFTNPPLLFNPPDSQLATDAFIPLGDPPTGTGIVRVRPTFIASGSWYGFEPHVVVGAELGTTTGITNDFIYEVGLAYTIFNRVTFVADLLGRHAFDVQRPRILKNLGPGSTANPDTLNASFGIKANPIGTLVVFLNFIVPLNEVGVRDDLTPAFGLEWSF